MKRIIVILLAALAFGAPAAAQTWDRVNGSMQVKSGPSAPLVIIDQTAAGQKIASFRSNGTEKCYVDTSGNLNCAGTFTLTGQFLAGDGSASAPSYSFTSETTTGLFRPTSGALGVGVNGNSSYENAFTNTGMKQSADALLSWSQTAGNPLATADVSLSRGAAGQLNTNSSIARTGANGQLFNDLQALTELTTIAAAATTDTTIQMPANSVVLAVSVRVTTVIPTAATFTVGDSGSAARFSTAAVSTAANSTDSGTKAGAYYNASALSIRITPNLTPGANTGRVRVTIYYYTVTPPTS